MHLRAKKKRVRGNDMMHDVCLEGALHGGESWPDNQLGNAA